MKRPNYLISLRKKNTKENKIYRPKHKKLHEENKKAN